MPAGAPYARLARGRSCCRTDPEGAASACVREAGAATGYSRFRMPFTRRLAQLLAWNGVSPSTGSVDGLDPFEEKRHGRFCIVGEIALEEIVEHAGVGLTMLSVAAGRELALGQLDGDAVADMQVERAS